MSCCGSSRARGRSPSAPIRRSPPRPRSWRSISRPTRPMSRCSRAPSTISGPMAGASFSTAPARAASTRSSSRARRSTATATSISTSSATTRIPRRASPAPMARPISISWCRASSSSALEHSRRTLVEQVDFVSAPGTSPPNVYRRGGPIALVTPLCHFAFDKAKARFRLESVHPGHTRRRSARQYRLHLRSAGNGAGDAGAFGRDAVAAARHRRAEARGDLS